MTCMTTKQKFDVEDPEVVVLNNGRFAYKAKCPWTGKAGKELYAFKFCSSEAHRMYVAKTTESEHDQDKATESEHSSAESEQQERPASP